MVLPGAFFSWSTLLRSGWSSRWCRLCTGAACQPWMLLEEFTLLRCLPCRAVRTWETGHFSFALVSFSLFWRLGVACEYSVLKFSGDPHLVRQSLLVLRGLWRNLHIFYVAVNSNPEAFGLHSGGMEKRAQSMLLVAASLSAFRTLEVDITSTSSPFLGSLRQFSLLSAAFFGPSMMKNSSSSRAHANWTVMPCRHRVRISLTSDTNNHKEPQTQRSVLTGEEPPPHSGELKHSLTQAGGPTQSQLSRPMSSGHHISMEHRLRRKQLNSDTNASKKKYLKEIQEKRKEETFSSEKMKKENEKNI